MMIAGLFLRGIGFIALGICSDFYTISISSALIGFGTAFYEPRRSRYIWLTASSFEKKIYLHI